MVLLKSQKMHISVICTSHYTPYLSSFSSGLFSKFCPPITHTVNEIIRTSPYVNIQKKSVLSIKTTAVKNVRLTHFVTLMCSTGIPVIPAKSYRKLKNLYISVLITTGYCLSTLWLNILVLHRHFWIFPQIFFTSDKNLLNFATLSQQSSSFLLSISD